MGAAMSTFPYALGGPPAVVEPAAEPAPVDAPLIVAPDLAAPSRRWRAVLAPLLPTLFLLALCIAGLADPPAPAAGESGASSRLHVPAEAPRYLPSVPLTR